MNRSFFVILLSVAPWTVNAQGFTRILRRGEVYRVGLPKVILMDTTAFAKYRFYEQQFLILQGTVWKIDYRYRQMDSAYMQKVDNLNGLLKMKDIELEVCKGALRRTNQEAVKNLGDNLELAKKLGRRKKGIRIWKTIATVTTGLAVILLL